MLPRQVRHDETEKRVICQMIDKEIRGTLQARFLPTFLFSFRGSISSMETKKFLSKYHERKKQKYANIPFSQANINDM